MYPNRKQFIISKSKVIKDTFKHIELNNNYILSYDKGLNIASTIRNDKECYILGYTYQTDSSLEDPIIEISSSEKSIEDIIYNWSGRYIVIYNNEIFLDELGQLHIYYNDENNLISSSIGLIREIIDFDNLDYDTDDIIYDYNGKDDVEIFPGPMTEVSNIMVMLSNQTLSFNKKITIMSKNILYKRIESSLEESILAFEKKMITLMKNIDKTGNVNAALTSGFDSRATVSLLKKANIDFTAFTYHNFETPNRLSEIIIPMLICDDINIAHSDIEMGELDEKRKRIIYYHLGYKTTNSFYKRYIHRQDLGIENNSIVLDSAMYGVGKNFSERFIEAEKKYAQNKYVVSDMILKYLPSIKMYDLTLKSFNRWIEMIDIFNLNELTIKELYYIQQRTLLFATDYQMKDLCGYVNIPIINSGVFISLIRRIYELGHHTFPEDILMVTNSDLLKYNVNPKKIENIYKTRRDYEN